MKGVEQQSTPDKEPSVAHTAAVPGEISARVHLCARTMESAINNSSIIILIFLCHYGNNEDDNYNPRDWNAAMEAPK